MIRDDLARTVEQAAQSAMADGALPRTVLPEIVIERPARPEHGDYATNLPLRLARAARANPLDLARTLASRIPLEGPLSAAEAAPPGFINFRLSEPWLARQVDAIVAAGATFGDVALGGGARVQVEFVSANPTGPLTAGNGRGAAIGSVLASVLAAAGYAVEREYLVNDAGTQTEVFGRTLVARYLQLFGNDTEIPADGYPGEYMLDIARQLRDEFGDRFVAAGVDAPPVEMVLRGVDIVVEWIQADLRRLGVTYDVWFRERWVYERENVYERAMQVLREKEYLVEKEGALWFASTELGEDKDNVVVRSTGRPTYFASDIAYHYDKFVGRGFDRVIDVWGADHQGHVSRMKAAVEALGVDPGRLDILIYQLVSFRRGDELVRLSKRAGNIVLIRDVVEEVGADAARFFFLARSADSQMEFDLELAKRQSAENPVYYVQYAHARIAGIIANAGGRLPAHPDGDGDVALLVHPAELALIRKMLELPELVALMARKLEPHHLPHYAQELATAFHAFYTECLVLDAENVPLSLARLKLCRAAKVALARALTLMGMTTPERM
ncbi:MAG TPA: arginine--tRNA ligase [Dehalococcoidia bacterium]|nr:arginine--tRNA ligase [Dehalococcoidia bacterium]